MLKSIVHQRRPLGVTLLASAMSLQAVWLLVSAFLLFLSAIISASGYNAALAVIGAFSSGLALFILLFAWALWRLKRWAYWATLIIQCINTGEYLLAFFSGGGWFNFLALCFSVAILVYFLANSHVRAAFFPPRQARPSQIQGAAH